MRETLRSIEATLAAAGVASPLADARALVSAVTGIEAMALTFADPLTPDQRRDLEQLVARRAAREPLQHILGAAPFGPVELRVGPGVFIPRPETELLAHWAVEHCPPGAVVVDLCTGSGALAAYLAHYRPDAHIHAVELSEQALTYARGNLASYPQVTVVAGDVTDPQCLDELSGAVDLVVSNPPYVPKAHDLEPEVYHDPDMAVFSGVDGMDVIRQLVPTVARLLRPGGAVGIEHDETTQPLVMAALDALGFEEIEAQADWAAKPRFVCAKMKR